jgi:hypothetical protein
VRESRRLIVVGDLVGGMLPPSRGGLDLIAIGRAWPQIVGEVVARETWPARLDADGSLLVHASSSLWVAELTLLAQSVLARLAETLGSGAPARVVFRIGPVPAIGGPAPAPSAPPISDQVRAAAAELSASIADDELRAAAERALARAIVRSTARPDSA